MTGTVKWFNPQMGWGWIAPDDGSSDVFVHFSGIVTAGYKTLREGEEVSFEITREPSRRAAKAINVVRLSLD